MQPITTDKILSDADQVYRDTCVVDEDFDLYNFGGLEIEEEKEYVYEF